MRDQDKTINMTSVLFVLAIWVWGVRPKGLAFRGLGV